VIFLMNHYDPRLPEHRKYVFSFFNDTPTEAWARWQHWLIDKTVGEPMPTPDSTVEDLKAQNIVGIYGPDVTP
jgi:hypothetical protein